MNLRLRLKIFSFRHPVSCCWNSLLLLIVDLLSSEMTTEEIDFLKGSIENKECELFFLNRWLHRISRILAVLDYEGVKQATREVLRPKRKSSAHFTMT